MMYFKNQMWDLFSMERKGKVFQGCCGNEGREEKQLFWLVITKNSIWHTWVLPLRTQTWFYLRSQNPLAPNSLLPWWVPPQSQKLENVTPQRVTWTVISFSLPGFTNSIYFPSSSLPFLLLHNNSGDPAPGPRAPGAPADSHIFIISMN